MSTPTHSIISNQDGTYSVALLTGIDGNEINTTWGEFATYVEACESAQSDARERSDAPAVFGDRIREPKKSVTFDQFQNSSIFVDDLSQYVEICFNDEKVPGYLYLGSFYIEEIQRTAGDDRPTLNVELGSGEYLFETLEQAEKFLWDEFVMSETNLHLRYVRFCFGDDTTYDGYADGTTWNGFDNVRVTEKVHKAVIAHFTAEAGLGIDLDDALQSFNEIEPDDQRLYDYGNGFATQIDEDWYHTVNR